ncbi:MAG: YceI family protein [Actinobacteria bacterium]|nr:YceI family protein [Actinomycetota bacterium]
MRRWLLLGLGIVVLVVGAGAAWLWFAGGSGEPSTELTTPPLADDSTTTGGATTPSAPETTVTGGDSTAFVIDPALSTATYEVDEILRGSPNHVAGVTSEVAGQVAFDPGDLGTVRFSEILINARTFETDSSTRDRQVRGPVVLNSASDEFEFISFQPTSVDGLPTTVSVGETVTAQVVGDLTIKGTTQEVTFDLTVTFVDDATISGTATAVVLRSEFGIDIPQVASVAGVDDEVTLTLDFVAVAG